MGRRVRPHAHIVQIEGCKCKDGQIKISKTILNNSRNIEEAGEQYRQDLSAIIERVRETKADSAEETFKEVARSITRPWDKMAQRRPMTRIPHWNTSMELRWR